MKKVNSTVKIYDKAVKKLLMAQVTALEKTAEALHTEVVKAQVMPFDSGDMQNKNTFVDTSESKRGTVSIVSQTPYARRLYFHPEYNFRTVENRNARGKWFEPWTEGEEKDFCKNIFTELYKKEAGL